MKAWGIGASAGMAAQVSALAAALGADLQMKNVPIKKPFVWFPNGVYAAGLDRFVMPHLLAQDSDKLLPPWPDLVISCGRRGAIAALGLKKHISCHPSSVIRHPFFIHIQDPHINPRHFDLVVAMEHDNITGSNVLKTHFALHRITPEVLAAAQTRFAPVFADYAAPYVSVLLGGSTNKYILTKARMQAVIDDLRKLRDAVEGSLLITPSRRTGAENIAMLQDAFAGDPRVYIYNFKDENPYMGLLALAECIVVSNDSVNMMSEAAATGKPLYLLNFEGHKNTKPARFAQTLIDNGIARKIRDRLEQWQYRAENEMERLAGEIKARLSNR